MTSVKFNYETQQFKNDQRPDLFRNHNNPNLFNGRNFDVIAAFFLENTPVINYPYIAIPTVIAVSITVSTAAGGVFGAAIGAFGAAIASVIDGKVADAEVATICAIVGAVIGLFTIRSEVSEIAYDRLGKSVFGFHRSNQRVL